MFPKDGALDPRNLMVRGCSLPPAACDSLPKAPGLYWEVMPEEPASSCTRKVPKCGLVDATRALGWANCVFLA